MDQRRSSCSFGDRGYGCGVMIIIMQALVFGGCGKVDVFICRRKGDRWVAAVLSLFYYLLILISSWQTYQDLGVAIRARMTPVFRRPQSVTFLLEMSRKQAEDNHRLVQYKKTMYMRYLQAHDQEGWNYHTFEYLSDHTRIRQQDYAENGVNAAGATEDRIHLEKVNI